MSKVIMNHSRNISRGSISLKWRHNARNTRNGQGEWAIFFLFGPSCFGYWVANSCLYNPQNFQITTMPTLGRQSWKGGSALPHASSFG